MSLRDNIHKDIDSVFLNIDDLAETHLIEDIEIKCVIDAYDVTRAKSLMGDIESNTFTVYFKTSDYPLKLREGMYIKYDRKECHISSYTEDYGMTVLRLEQIR